MSESQTESKGTCDFCQMYQAEYGINDNLWWICTPCMFAVYGGCVCTPDLMHIHYGECKIKNPPVKFLDGEEE